jgi:lysine 2,3-aminomutase
MSYWGKNYRTSVERDDVEAVDRKHVYYDPIHTLPPEGQAWWREHGHADGVVTDEALAAAASSRAAAAAELAAT